jgi:hypothetical protein
MGSMRKGDRVTEMFAFLSIDPVDDCEGVPSFLIRHIITGQPTEMPLIAADKERVESLRVMARKIKESRPGIKMRLVRFSQIETLEEIE